MKNIAIFASGSGSNAENIVKYFQHHNDIKVNLILSNKSTSKVLERAKKLNIPSIYFTKEDFLYTDIVVDKLKKKQIHFVILAGFLLKLPQNLLDVFPNKILNIHPSLLPKYGGKGMYGINVHNAVIENKETKSGISIHFVNENFDEGKIIFQAKIKIDTKDTPKSLAQKIHHLEYEHFPKIIEKTVLSL